ncbi:nicotinamide n-methyltransferase [Ascosphaera atra]|nr:nicotinamide n-methyltransferase [Ascosphaera atra]
MFGYLLWNAGRTVADFLEDNAESFLKNRNILELGAGAGLPSLVAAIYGARTVVVTDYPDIDLVNNLHINVENVAQLIPMGTSLRVEGYRWGNSVNRIMSHLPTTKKGFDVVILADVIYNCPQHMNIIKSIRNTLMRSPDAVALVVSTPYQPWLFEKVWAFFPLAEQNGFTVSKIFEKRVEEVLFKDDPGDEIIRRTVYGYELRWKPEEIKR